MCSSIHSKVETRASQINFTFFSFKCLVTALTKGGFLIDVTPRKEDRGVRPENTIFLIFSPRTLSPQISSWTAQEYCPRGPGQDGRKNAGDSESGAGETADSRAMEGKAEESTRPFSV